MNLDTKLEVNGDLFQALTCVLGAAPTEADTRAVIASLGREAEFDALIASGVVLDGLPYDAQMVGLFR